MAHITETISGDRRIQLGNEGYLRKMHFGANWTKLRIGIRFSINGRSTIVAPSITLGVCADANSGYYEDRSNGFIGVYNGVIGNYNYVHSQAVTSYYTWSSNNMTGTIYKTNDTVSTTNTTWGLAMCFSATATPPNVLMVTILKINSAYYLVDEIGPTFTTVQAGQGLHSFYKAMEDEAGSTISASLSRIANAAPGNLIGSTNVPMPYVYVGWNKSTPTLEITHIAVTKFI